jgi:gluconolactonase
MRQINVSLKALLLIGIVGGLALHSQAASIDELVEVDTLELIATGFTFTEGPVWHPDGYLLFSDIPGNTIYKWTPKGEVEIFRSPSGHSNGLIFDRQGRLIACEHSNRQVSRTEPDGTIVTLTNEYDGSRLNSPNDAIVKSDGSIYFTDPYGLGVGLGIPTGTQELPFDGVYRLSPDGEMLELLEADILSNGLAFSRDEKVLYVMAQQPNCIYAYDVQPDGLLANRRVLAELSAWPDGMKVDIRGNLYVTNNTSTLQVFDSEGMHLGDIVTPKPASNCAFGGADNRTLFITAETSVYRVQTKLQGAIPAFDDLEKARAVSPTPGITVDLQEASLLSWIGGEAAVQHDVYFATDFNDVNSVDVNDTTSIYRGRQDLVIYTLPEGPKLDQSYYWRIDEVKDDNTIHKGDVWSFTTQEFLIVDDFEDYNDYEPYTIYLAWVDGYDNPANGSTVGYPNPDWGAGEHFVETAIIHGGEQAMPLFYSNIGGATYSEAERTFTVPQDWTKAGIQTLVLYFYGSAGNTGQLYVKVNESKLIYEGDVTEIQQLQWNQWNIDLTSFGVNLQNVTMMSIGIDDNGASGTLYFDDIRLYVSIPNS